MHEGTMCVPEDFLSLPFFAHSRFADVSRGLYGGAPVAIKQLRGLEDESGAGSSQAGVADIGVEDLMKEACLLAQLRHPNITQFMGVVLLEPPKVWIVTEYCPNGSLKNFLNIICNKLYSYIL